VTISWVRTDPSMRVLILPAPGEQDDVLRAVKAGAIGYLVKSASPDSSGGVPPPRLPERVAGP
jgi:DNA-binding NarL/FixJ family response regulator